MVNTTVVTTNTQTHKLQTHKHTNAQTDKLRNGDELTDTCECSFVNVLPLCALLASCRFFLRPFSDVP